MLHSLSCAWILSRLFIDISTTICSCVDAPHNFNTSLPLYLKHFPIGHLLAAYIAVLLLSKLPPRHGPGTTLVSYLAFFPAFYLTFSDVGTARPQPRAPDLSVHWSSQWRSEAAGGERGKKEKEEVTLIKSQMSAVLVPIPDRSNKHHSR